MMVLGEAQYLHGAGPLIVRDQDKTEDGYSDAELKVSIPPRYRDGLGGIDLEQVKRDQRRARRKVMRAALDQLGRLRSRR